MQAGPVHAVSLQAKGPTSPNPHAAAPLPNRYQSDAIQPTSLQDQGGPSQSNGLHELMLQPISSSVNLAAAAAAAAAAGSQPVTQQEVRGAPQPASNGSSGKKGLAHSETSEQRRERRLQRKRPLPPPHQLPHQGAVAALAAKPVTHSPAAPHLLAHPSTQQGPTTQAVTTPAPSAAARQAAGTAEEADGAAAAAAAAKPRQKAGKEPVPHPPQAPTFLPTASSGQRPQLPGGTSAAAEAAAAAAARLAAALPHSRVKRAAMAPAAPPAAAVPAARAVQTSSAPVTRARQPAPAPAASPASPAAAAATSGPPSRSKAEAASAAKSGTVKAAFRAAAGKSQRRNESGPEASAAGPVRLKKPNPAVGSAATSSLDADSGNGSGADLAAVADNAGGSRSRPHGLLTLRGEAGGGSSGGSSSGEEGGRGGAESAGDADPEGEGSGGGSGRRKGRGRGAKRRKPQSAAGAPQGDSSDPDAPPQPTQQQLRQQRSVRRAEKVQHHLQIQNLKRRRLVLRQRRGQRMLYPFHRGFRVGGYQHRYYAALLRAARPGFRPYVPGTTEQLGAGAPPVEDLTAIQLRFPVGILLEPHHRHSDSVDLRWQGSLTTNLLSGRAGARRDSLVTVAAACESNSQRAATAGQSGGGHGVSDDSDGGDNTGGSSPVQERTPVALVRPPALDSETPDDAARGVDLALLALRGPRGTPLNFACSSYPANQRVMRRGNSLLRQLAATRLAAHSPHPSRLLPRVGCGSCTACTDPWAHRKCTSLLFNLPFVPSHLTHSAADRVVSLLGEQVPRGRGGGGASQGGGGASDHEDGPSQGGGGAADHEDGPSQGGGGASDHEDGPSQGSCGAADHEERPSQGGGGAADHEEGPSQGGGGAADHEEGPLRQAQGRSSGQAAQAPPQRGGEGLPPHRASPPSRKPGAGARSAGPTKLELLRRRRALARQSGALAARHLLGSLPEVEPLGAASGARSFVRASGAARGLLRSALLAAAGASGPLGGSSATLGGRSDRVGVRGQAQGSDAPEWLDSVSIHHHARDPALPDSAPTAASTDARAHAPPANSSPLPRCTWCASPGHARPACPLHALTTSAPARQLRRLAVALGVDRKQRVGKRQEQGVAAGEEDGGLAGVGVQQQQQQQRIQRRQHTPSAAGVGVQPGQGSEGAGVAVRQGQQQQQRQQQQGQRQEDEDERGEEGQQQQQQQRQEDEDERGEEGQQQQQQQQRQEDEDERGEEGGQEGGEGGEGGEGRREGAATASLRRLGASWSHVERQRAKSLLGKLQELSEYPTGLDLLPPDVVGVMSAVASAYPWSYNVTPLTMHKTANTGTVTQLSLQMTLALALLGMEAAAAAAGLSCPAPGSGV
ncbi:MAG: hypothetical protein WDW38_008925 [Sanguina aurantia]